MTSWAMVVSEAPDVAGRVEARFRAHRHATLATLRRDDPPRISGVETQFGSGEMTMGMMGGSRKALDLQRDPRFALHSATVDPELTEPDARVTGLAVEVTDQTFLDAWRGDIGEIPSGPFHLFRVEVTELVLIGVDGDHLVIESWHAGRGVVRVERS